VSRAGKTKEVLPAVPTVQDRIAPVGGGLHGKIDFGISKGGTKVESQLVASGREGFPFLENLT
jgi:hypothetical protein